MGFAVAGCRWWQCTAACTFTQHEQPPSMQCGPAQELTHQLRMASDSRPWRAVVAHSSSTSSMSGSYRGSSSTGLHSAPLSSLPLPSLSHHPSWLASPPAPPSAPCCLLPCPDVLAGGAGPSSTSIGLRVCVDVSSVKRRPIDRARRQTAIGDGAEPGPAKQRVWRMGRGSGGSGGAGSGAGSGALCDEQPSP